MNLGRVANLDHGNLLHSLDDFQVGRKHMRVVAPTPWIQPGIDGSIVMICIIPRIGIRISAPYRSLTMNRVAVPTAIFAVANESERIGRVNVHLDLAARTLDNLLLYGMECHGGGGQSIVSVSNAIGFGRLYDMPEYERKPNRTEPNRTQEHLQTQVRIASKE